MADLISNRELDDLVLLDGEQISEEGVANSLSSRLRDGKMYTSIGPVLISVNPYKLLCEARTGKPIYDDSVADSYRGRTRLELPPHAFAIAEAAYTNLLTYGLPQGIIVSGESGAGKTEACRVILGYIARVSGAYAAASAGKGKYKPGQKAAEVEGPAAVALRVRDRLVTSGLVMEAFGNAQTLRNDNSSRFGKLMEVYFTPGGIAKGGAIRIYLLEKSRVVWQQEGERSFHVLYQLSAGADSSLKAQLKLKSGPEGFAYLQNEHRKIPGVNDAAAFNALTQCLRVLGVESSELSQWWKALAVVLHLGNVHFTSATEEQRRKDKAREEAEEEGEEMIEDTTAGEGSPSQRAELNPHAARPEESSETYGALGAVAALLGVEDKAVVSALTSRTLVIRGERTHAINTVRDAKFARDALAKGMYSRLFQAVTDRINASIAVHAKGGAAPAAVPSKAAAETGKGKKAAEPVEDPAKATASAPGGSPGAPSPGHDTTPDPAAAAAQEMQAEAEASAAEQARVCILDLYGFEVFPQLNGLPQLHINYVNERLQALFIAATLVEEQEEYAREGIAWEPVPYSDNTPVLTLLEGKPGVFALLDDACNVADSGEGAASAARGAFNKGKKTGPDTTFLHALNTKIAGESGHGAASKGGSEAASGKGSAVDAAAKERYKKSKIEDGTFTVQHYAGPCTYNVQGMVASNKDSLSNDLLTLMGKASGIPLLQDLFADHRSADEKAKRPPTATQAFRMSVAALVETLSATQPHYVRCVKSNPKKAALTADEDMMLHQTRYLGLVENVRVRRAGWAFRESYDSFLRRYRILSTSTWPGKDGAAEEQVRTLMSNLWLHEKPRGAVGGVGIVARPQGPMTVAQRGAANTRGGRGGMAMMPAARGRPGMAMAPRGGGAAGAAPGRAPAQPAAPSGPDPLASITGQRLPGDVQTGGARKLVEGEDFQFGSSKLFIRQANVLFALEYMRGRALGAFQQKVAATWRAYDGKRQYKKIVAAWHRVIASAQAHLARKRYLKMRASAIRIQAVVRGHLTRLSPVVEDMREGLGLVSCYGKVRRRLSLRWQPKPAVSNDYLGLLQATNGMPVLSAESLVQTLSSLSPTQACNKDGLAYADHVLKIRQTYKVVRRAVLVTQDYIISLADPWSKGSVKRAIRILDVEKLSWSPYRDRYITIHQTGPRGYAFTAICQTAPALFKAILARHKALTGMPNGIPVETMDTWQYKAYPSDGPEKARTLRISLVPSSQAFDAHAAVREAWERDFLQAPGPQGGVGGRYAETVLAGNIGTFPEESLQPFHELAVGDRSTLLVSCPVPGKQGLKELLTDKEKEALKKMNIKTAVLNKL